MAIGANRRTGHTDAGSAQTAGSADQAAQADTVAAGTTGSVRREQAQGQLRLLLLPISIKGRFEYIIYPYG